MAKIKHVSEEDALKIVGRAVDKAIGNLKQKIAASLDSKINSILREFTDGVADRIQQQYEHIDGQRSHLDFLVMPNGTRLFRSTPERSVLVLEQPPSVRTLCIPEGVSEDSESRNYGNNDYTPRSYAIPYSIWIFPLCVDGHGRWHIAPNERPYLGWRKKPLHSGEDYMAVPILPNVNSDFGVCMGETVATYNGSKDLCTFTEQFLKTYWQSQFSRDYNSEYLSAKKRHPNYFKNLSSWAKASREDASFMVSDKVQFNEVKVHDVASFVRTLLVGNSSQNSDRSTSLLRSSIRSVIKDESWALTEAVREHLDTIDISTLHKGKQEARIVREYMSQFVAQACDKVRETWDAEMRATLDEVERRQEALAAKILSEDGDSVVKHAAPRVGGCDLVNPW